MSSPIDGHCPYCNKETTYKLNQPSIYGGTSHLHTKFINVRLICSRNNEHEIKYFIKYSDYKIQKVGQYPSFADIINDQVKKYRSIMSHQDGQEFHKAIGLAAHGVGVGAYVYLRRVFERLILAKFHESKDLESWDESEFLKMRMVDRINHLGKYLPEFLVKNSKIYSILSIGIHELSEEVCLQYFETLKDTIIFILDDDKKKREQEALRKKLEIDLSKMEVAT